MPSKSMSSTMPIQSKIGEASLKFGPDWLRALSSDNSTTGGSDPGSARSGSGGGGGGGWSSGSGGGGGTIGGDERRSNSNHSYQHQHHSNHHHPPSYHHQTSRDKDENRRSSYNSNSGRSSEGGSGGGGSGAGSGSALSNDKPPNNPNRFKIPENRYTREEILTLYDKNLSPPEYLLAHGTLFIEKMQPPLAFSQPSEEELRIWHIAQPESSSRQGSSGGGIGTSPVSRGVYIPRGRGGLDRGRGRGRGGSGYYAPPGRPSDEEERSGSYSRTRTFERSQSAHETTRWATNERERNGQGGTTGSSPPEDGSSRGGGNWRNRNSDSYGKQRFEESDDGWRRPRWRRDDEEDSPSSRSSSRRVHKSWSDDGTHDNLPEWAKDTPGDDGGAFLDDDRYSIASKTNAFEISRRGGGGVELEKPSKEVKSDGDSHGSQSDRVQKRTPERSDKKSVISTSLKEEEEPEELLPAEKNFKATNPASSTGYRPGTLEPSLDKYSSANSTNDTNRVKPTEPSPPAPAQVKAPEVEHPGLGELKSVFEALQNRQQHSQQQPNKHFLNTEEDPYYSMTEEADSLVSKLIEEDANRAHASSLTHHRNLGQHLASHNDSNLLPSSVIPSAAPHVTHQQPQPPAHVGSPDIWFYRDPQGNVQGPFATTEMLLWLNQGYFSGGLLLRRECDRVFITLSEMGNLYSRNPFETGHTSPIPPPLPLAGEPISSASDPSIQAQAQYQRQQLLQQNALREQQQFLLNLIQGQAPGGGRKEEEPWKAGHHQQQPGLNGPQGPATAAQAQLQAQMLLNMVKNAGINASDANPIEHLQALFQRQAQDELLRRKKVEDEQLRRKKLEEEKELERKRFLEEEENRKRLEEQKRLEMEEEKKRKALEEHYLLQQKKQAELIQQQAEEMARQKELILQQQRQQQELARRQAEQELLEQQRLEQQRAEQQRAEQQRAEQQRAEQLRFEKQQQQQREQLEREEQQRRHQLELEEQKQQQRRLQLEQQQKQQALEQQQKQQALEQQKKQQSLEQQKFSWNAAQTAAPVIIPLSQARSLREIQEEESAKEREENLKLQAMKKMQEQQQRVQQQQQAKASAAAGGISLKWAQTTPPQKTSIKSLAEIQAEEQATAEMVQQSKRERQAIIQHNTQVQQAWSSSLTWANRASLNAPSSGSAPKTNGGVWEDVGKLSKNSSNNHTTAPANNASNRQSTQKRTKEADDPFLKMFQDHGVNMAKHQSPSHGHSQSQPTPGDEFTRWCYDTVQGIGGGNVDVPTFISFLKEVESPFEVNDYIRSYLGDGKEAREFGKGFLERRSRWNKARKGKDVEGVNFEDNLCRPASAVNPPTAEFQEVKGKKGKKGKMQKVDARILGFNTTSAPDRVNVGKRDYGDGSDN